MVSLVKRKREAPDLQIPILDIAFDNGLREIQMILEKGDDFCTTFYRNLIPKIKLRAHFNRGQKTRKIKFAFMSSGVHIMQNGI